MGNCLAKKFLRGVESRHQQGGAIPTQFVMFITADFE